MAERLELHESLDGLRVTGPGLLQQTWFRWALGGLTALVLVVLAVVWIGALRAPPPLVKPQCEPVGLTWNSPSTSMHPSCAELYPDAAAALQLEVVALRRRAYWIERLQVLYFPDAVLPEATWREQRGALVEVPAQMSDAMRRLPPDDVDALYELMDLPPLAEPPLLPVRLTEPDLRVEGALSGHTRDLVHHTDGRVTELQPGHPLLLDAERRTRNELQGFASAIRKLDAPVASDHRRAIDAKGTWSDRMNAQRERQRGVFWSGITGAALLMVLLGLALLGLTLWVRPLDLAIDRRFVRIGRKRLRWTDVYGARREGRRVVYLPQAGQRIATPAIADDHIREQVLTRSQQMVRHLAPPDPRQEAIDEQEGRAALDRLRRKAGSTGTGG